MHGRELRKKCEMCVVEARVHGLCCRDNEDLSLSQPQFQLVVYFENFGFSVIEKLREMRWQPRGVKD